MGEDPFVAQTGDSDRAANGVVAKAGLYTRTVWATYGDCGMWEGAGMRDIRRRRTVNRTL